MQRKFNGCNVKYSQPTSIFISGKKDITVNTGVVEAAEQYLWDYGATV